MSLNIPTPLNEESPDYSGTPDGACRELAVPISLAGERIDAGLARLLPEHSRSRLQNWIREGRVFRNGLPVLDPKYRLTGDEVIEIREAVGAAELAQLPEDIALHVVFEDEHILVIDKPAGLVVHPGSGNWSGTLLNALLAHSPLASELPRAGIVHRLDKDTSGLMVVAKTLVAQTDLVRQLQARTVKRHYAAIVIGSPPNTGAVDEPIARHPVNRTKMAAVASGKPARTHFHVVERWSQAAWVECALETGRTHQIRVHMTHIGHPLVGDTVYTGRKPQPAPFARQALHAFRLGLNHPTTRESMQWEIGLPADMQELIERLREMSGR